MGEFVVSSKREGLIDNGHCESENDELPGDSRVEFE